jgi:iron complex outermembrane receptor protein
VALLFILFFPFCTAVAQELRQVYAQAEADYQIGRIEQARDTLLLHLGAFRGNERQNALRLIALSYLVRFDFEQTEQYARLMLQQNPYYTVSPQDPPKFADIVNNIKAGMTATITTASSQAETLAEVPVPTTLITEEMIRTSGARNLQEVLAAYVPGMHIVDNNDDINIAMRGIYSNTQEKILIMLNGHRLNSYATNTAAPDFSISLEKIKQIEVLRGPASSLYGGVALTAVVNIITKQGADVDGLQAKVGAGNYGQLRGDAVFGKRYFDVDMLVWGSIYRNNGEKYVVTNERPYDVLEMPVDHITIGRIGKHPSYDFGLQLGWKGFQLMYDSHYSQVVAPYTMSSLALSYDYDRYRTFNGVGPSFSTYSYHSDLNYQFSIANCQFKIGATYDNVDLTRYQVVSDIGMPILRYVMGLPKEMETVLDDYGGISRYINGQEQDFGIQLKGNYAYTLGGGHKGNIGFGAEYNHFRLNDMRYQIGYDFKRTFNEDPMVLDASKGSENSGNAYLQLKHQWHSLILNAGLRYDYKHRYNHSKVRELSPRVALIYLRPQWNVKLSYSKSFVDAPYIYRKFNDISYVMNGMDVSRVKDLSPERVHSFQLSFAGTNWVKGLNFEINGFYNTANDLIFTHITEYINGGKNQTCGVELMADGQWTMANGQRLTANFALAWTKTIKANLLGLESFEGSMRDRDPSDINDNNNTPSIMANLVAGWKITPQLKLHTHLTFEGKQTSYNYNILSVISIGWIIDAMDEYKIEDIEPEDEIPDWMNDYTEQLKSAMQDYILRKDIPARAILNIGGEYTIGSLTLGLNIHNLLGTRYYRSGMNTNLIPQQGRWWQVSIAYKI